jgi:hypothetical protein
VQTPARVGELSEDARRQTRSWLKRAHGCCQTPCVNRVMATARRHRGTLKHRTPADSAKPARGPGSRHKRAREWRGDGRRHGRGAPRDLAAQADWCLELSAKVVIACRWRLLQAHRQVRAALWWTGPSSAAPGDKPLPHVAARSCHWQGCTSEVQRRVEQLAVLLSRLHVSAFTSTTAGLPGPQRASLSKSGVNPIAW